MSDPGSERPLRAVVAGGGVAGLEAVMALHDLAGERVAVTLVAPDEHFVYHPLSTGDPFALGETQRMPLESFARQFGAEHRRTGLRSVLVDTHTAVLGDGSSLVYDRLLVAVGARRVPAYENATTFRGQEDVEALHGLVQDVEAGYVKRIAFVVPPGVGWTLPLYELALMMARRAFESAADAEMSLVTPEERPLPVFGAQASSDVQAMLDAAGVRVRTSAIADVPARGRVVLRSSDETIDCDRVVALPVVEPIAIEGLPVDSHGFLPIDAHCRLAGAAGVYAAGDGANFPLKQGGIACQQADVAAEDIARAAGVPVPESTFRPVLRGQLLTGAKPHFMRHDVGESASTTDSSGEHLLWWPPSKVAGRYLGPYMAGAEVTEGDEVELTGYEFVTR